MTALRLRSAASAAQGVLSTAVVSALAIVLCFGSAGASAQVYTSLWMSSGGAVGETAQFEIAQTTGNQPFAAFWTFAQLYRVPGPVIVPVAAGLLNAQGRASFRIVVPDAPTLVGLRISVFAGNPQLYTDFLWPLAARSSATASKVGTLVSHAMDPTVVGLPDGRFVLTGGRDRKTNQATTAVFIYDPRTNRLTSAGTLATARYGHLTTVLSNGKVFVVGGNVTHPEVYDPTTGTSKPLAGSLPSFSIDDCVAVRDLTNPAEWVVVNQGGHVWAYDVATGSVSTFTNPNTSSGQAVTAIPGKPEYVFVGGGLIRWPAASNAVESLNLRTGKWTTLGQVTFRSASKAIAIGPYLLIAGGLIRGGEVDDVDLFDTVSRTNYPLPRLTVTRIHYFSIGFVPSGVLRVAGGGGAWGDAGTLVEEISTTRSTPLRPVNTPASTPIFTFGRDGTALCIADQDVFYLP